MLARDPPDLGLHRRGRLAALHHAAARDDHGGTPAAAAASVTDAARNGLSATTARSGRSGSASSDG